MRRRAATVALCGVVLLAGCSSHDSGGGLSTGAGAMLHSDVLALTRAAAAGNWAAAGGALSQLRSDLAEAVRAGDVDAERGARIQATITAVAGDLALHAPASSSARTSTSASRSATAAKTSKASTHAAPVTHVKAPPKAPPKQPAPKPGHGGGKGKKTKHP